MRGKRKGRRKGKRYLAAVALALGAAVLPAGQAEAHNYDTLSYFYCSAHRQNPATNVIHSWPYLLEPGLIGYWCVDDFFGVRHQYWVHVSPPGSSNSWRPWTPQKCWPAPGFVTYCHGPAHTTVP